MTGRLHGKGALVTGAASGIGLAVAIRFAAEGAVVAFADRDADRLGRAVTGVPDAVAVVMDVTDEDSIMAAYADVAGRGLGLNVVVANAGIQLFGQDAAVDELSLAVWRQTLEVNLTGTFLTVKHAARALRGRGGSIVVTGSPTGVVGSARGFTAYSSSKAGAHGLVRVAAADLAPSGIRVNAVVPGYTETPLVSQIAEDPARRAALLSSVPLGRAGTPADVEGLMVYLASDESRYATGALFTVDGGATAV